MKRYEYMINYSYPRGRGRMRIVSSDKIKSYEDIEKIDEVVRSNKNDPKAFVTDFKLLREYDEEE